jgi:hypothetical protein
VLPLYVTTPSTAALAQGGCDRQNPKDYQSLINLGTITYRSGEMLNPDKLPAGKQFSYTLLHHMGINKPHDGIRAKMLG